MWIDVHSEDTGARGADAALRVGFDELAASPAIITHRELKLLRQCAGALRRGNRFLVVHGLSKHAHKVRYLVTTLTHLGVSCGDIHVVLTGEDAGAESHGLRLPGARLTTAAGLS